ncbi:MAG: hypothetical protein CM1200mP37_8690 [Chloroflexota bacterium]|nr:MAG: hypothetical protein CM1200mP37_8690 [Chloroflexota bacterium]
MSAPKVPVSIFKSLFSNNNIVLSNKFLAASLLAASLKLGRRPFFISA